MSLKVETSIHMLNRMIRRFGSQCYAQVKGRSPVRFRAFVEDANRTRRGVTGSRMLDAVIRELGTDTKRRTVIYAPYDSFWSDDPSLRIIVRGKSYTVEYWSFVTIGDKPVYIWAILYPVASTKGDYPDSLDEDDEYYYTEDDA